MPFLVAKGLALVAQPTTLALLLTAAGVWLLQTGRRRTGLWLAWGGIGYLFGAGFLPLGNALILPLEQRFPVPDLAGTRVDGIVILGGFEDGWVSAGRNGLAVNESAERLTESLRLARHHPTARVVFTGGVRFRGTKELGGAGPVAEFLVDAGIDRERILLEPKARNTYENAAMTRDLVAPKSDERWLLVTSAYHMPRAMGLFRKAGFEVVAYPVDFRTRGPEDVTRFFERLSGGLMRSDTAINEWMGLLAYRVLGRIDEVFPSP